MVAPGRTVVVAGGPRSDGLGDEGALPDPALCDRPAVWIDDVVTPEARNWATARPAPTLLLAVDPATGLTRHAVDAALQWAARRARTNPPTHPR